ncbi:MAG: hypothetical protein M3081_02915 [Gemmatimonadota bacterium]|nr:hypothetical protein [Gemmatimonadota bacterium]
MIAHENDDNVALQDRVDALLRRGVIFSILWLAGIGSAIAFVSGLRARRLIVASNGTLRGGGRVWWCLIVGGVGIILWTPLVVVGIFNQFRC